MPTEADLLRRLFAQLPILATQIGCRPEATEEEQRVMHAAFAAAKTFDTVFALPLDEAARA